MKMTVEQLQRIKEMIEIEDELKETGATELVATMVRLRTNLGMVLPEEHFDDLG